MDDNDIRVAITLYQYSDTINVGARAQDVLRKLWDLFKTDEIGFHDLGSKGHHGEYQHRQGHDIRININYMTSVPTKARLAALSLVLVHEGTHATFPMDDIYDEMSARLIPIQYFRELSGPGVFNEDSDPPAPGKKAELVHLPRGTMPEFEEQSDALRHDQLIDYLFNVKTKDGYSYRSADAEWIVSHLTFWRGLGNRWPKTRGYYISVLAGEVDARYTRVILDIMESISKPEDWQTMMGQAGPLSVIQVALDDLSVSPHFMARILALERRWNVKLREEPPRR